MALEGVQGLGSLQEELLEACKVLEVEADVILPRVGGYSARPYSSALGLFEGIRASEFKALWRWWMRAALSRVYGGEKKLDRLDGEVSEILGGRLLGGGTRASCFGLRVEVVDERAIEEALKKYRRWHELLTEDLPRALSALCERLLKLCNKEGINVKVEVTLTPPVSIEVEPLDQRQVNRLEKRLRDSLDKISGVDVRLKKKGKKGRKRKIVSISVESYSGLLEAARRLDTNLGGVDLTAYDDLVKLAKVSRIKLLLLPRKEEGESNVWLYRGRGGRRWPDNSNKRYLKRVSEELVPPALRVPVRITVLEGAECLLGDAKVRFAVATLLLGLLLGGVGSASRRGFGSIAVKSVRAFNRYKEVLGECVKMFKGVLKELDERKLEEKLWELVRYVIEEGKRAFGAKLQVKGLPEVPTLDDEGGYFRLKAVRLGKGGYVDALERLGASTLKVEWKRAISMKEEESGRYLHTWILGLPRHVKGTGYFVGGEGGRRPSSIHLKLLELPSGEMFAVVYGFLSRDWPVKYLVHKSIPRSRRRAARPAQPPPPTPVLNIRVRKPDETPPRRAHDEGQLIREAFEAAFEFVVRILRSRAGGVGGPKGVGG